MNVGDIATLGRRNSLPKNDEANILPEVNKAVSLEVVEVELALGAQDIMADGFDGVVKKAAGLVGGQLIFNNRLGEDPRYQRIAGILVPHGCSGVDQIVYVLLGLDGTSMSIMSEDPELPELSSD